MQNTLILCFHSKIKRNQEQRENAILNPIIFLIIIKANEIDIVNHSAETLGTLNVKREKD